MLTTIITCVCSISIYCDAMIVEKWLTSPLNNFRQQGQEEVIIPVLSVLRVEYFYKLLKSTVVTAVWNSVLNMRR